jgi:hypothetical protein
MRYRLYIDEVGHANTGASIVNENERYLSLTGVAIEEGYMRDYVYPAMDELRTRYFGSHPDERVIFHRKMVTRSLLSRVCVIPTFRRGSTPIFLASCAA